MRTTPSDAFPDDAARHAAVAARDPAADGAFVYSVATTGVYCHPSCPSRAALPEHVGFHDGAAAAERAGFRPCRRCRADGPPPAERRAALVAAAARALEADAADGAVSVAAVAADLGVTRHALQRAFREATGLSPKGYQLAARRARLADTVARNARVTDAAFDGGYGSATRLHADAARRLGMTPSALRAGGRDQVIRRALADASLGRTLVAWTVRGLCAIELGDDDAALIASLEARFPAATFVADDGEGAALVQDALDRIEGVPGPELPLDVRGTVFQERVWAALQRIPVGTTSSYADVARAIGAPGASRAVARACGANPVAVLVPCHRVVRADGAPSGYRWGARRKAALLARERREV